jgi:hypothetical protein
MARIQTANGLSDSQSHFSRKHSRSSILEIDSWMPGKSQAISRLVDRLMRLIEGSQCFPGDEFDATEPGWTIEGRLVGPWVSELRTRWKEGRRTQYGRTCTVALRAVTFIDKGGQDSCESCQRRPHNSSRRVFTSGVYSINGNPSGSAACSKLFTASSVLSWEESSLPCPLCKRAGNPPFLLLAPSTHPPSLRRGRVL